MGMNGTGFSNQPTKLPKKNQNSFYTPIPGITARVMSIDWDNWTCEVQTITGDVKRNIRIPGPALTKSGDAYGRAYDLKEDQLVFVGFNMGVQNSGIILDKYPYYATDNDLNNLTTFINKYPEIQEGEYVDFHDSGYCIRYQLGNIIFQDMNKIPVLTINMVSGLVIVNKTLQVNTLSVIQDATIGTKLDVGTGAYKAIKTPSLTQWMTQTYATLAALQAAINAVIIVPLDGGASIKAALMAAFSNFPPPITPPDISNTNTGFGDP